MKSLLRAEVRCFLAGTGSVVKKWQIGMLDVTVNSRVWEAV